MKHNPYSVSKIGTFNTCQKKFKLQYIDKIKIEGEPQLALYRGSFAHEILQYGFDYSTKPKLNHVFTQEEADKVIEMVKRFQKSEVGIYIQELLDNDMTTEEDFAINKKLEFVDFFDKSAWLRGSADATLLDFDIKEIEANSLDEIPEGYELVNIIEK